MSMLDFGLPAIHEYLVSEARRMTEPVKRVAADLEKLSKSRPLDADDMGLVG